MRVGLRALTAAACLSLLARARSDAGPPVTTPSPPADFYVSPRGNDRWSGRLADPIENDGPFATVSQAREAVRALLKTQPGPICVFLRAGTYYLDSPLEYGPEDSGTQNAPVIYAAAASEEVTLSGG